MLLLYPLSARRIVGTDMLHASLLLWVAGAGHLLHGNVNLHAMAWLLVGSIPGVLVGSHLSVRVPERSLRIAFGFVLILSGIKLVGIPAATLIIEIAVALGALCSAGLARRPATPAPPAGSRRRVESPGVARVLSTAVVLALLAATAAAFVVTEGAKLEKSPIAGTARRCRLLPGERRAGEEERPHPVPAPHARAARRSGSRTPRAVGSRAALEPQCAPRLEVRPVWDGFSPGGVIFPDGVYKPVVKLERSHRTLVLPNPIQLDTKPPVITVRKTPHAIISPDGDGHNDSFREAYRVDQPAHGDPERPRAARRVHARPEADGTSWSGTASSGSRAGRSGPGCTCCARAHWTARGTNRSPTCSRSSRCATSTLARTRVVVAPGRRFFLRVSTDAPTVSWRLHGRSGVARAGTLRLRAPKTPGVYHLYVTASGHSATAAVVVG